MPPSSPPSSSSPPRSFAKITHKLLPQTQNTSNGVILHPLTLQQGENDLGSMINDELRRNKAKPKQTPRQRKNGNNSDGLERGIIIDVDECFLAIKDCRRIPCRRGRTRGRLEEGSSPDDDVGIFISRNVRSVGTTSNEAMKDDVIISEKNDDTWEMLRPRQMRVLGHGDAISLRWKGTPTTVPNEIRFVHECIVDELETNVNGTNKEGERIASDTKRDDSCQNVANVDDETEGSETTDGELKESNQRIDIGLPEHNREILANDNENDDGGTIPTARDEVLNDGDDTDEMQTQKYSIPVELEYGEMRSCGSTESSVTTLGNDPEREIGDVRFREDDSKKESAAKGDDEKVLPEEDEAFDLPTQQQQQQHTPSTSNRTNPKTSQESEDNNDENIGSNENKSNDQNLDTEALIPSISSNNHATPSLPLPDATITDSNDATTTTEEPTKDQRSSSSGKLNPLRKNDNTKPSLPETIPPCTGNVTTQRRGRRRRLKPNETNTDQERNNGTTTSSFQVSSPPPTSSKEFQSPPSANSKHAANIIMSFGTTKPERGIPFIPQEDDDDLNQTETEGVQSITRKEEDDSGLHATITGLSSMEPNDDSGLQETRIVSRTRHASPPNARNDDAVVKSCDTTSPSLLEEENTGVRVLITGLKVTNRHRKMVESIGAQLVETIQDAKSATHVIASDGKKPLRRTPKLMIGICRTSNILHLNWLTRSAKASKPLDCSDCLLLEDRDAETLYRFSMKETLANGIAARRSGGLLAGYRVYVCPTVAGHKAPPLGELQLIVEAAGGMVLDSLPSRFVDDEDCKMILMITSDPPTEAQVTETRVKDVVRWGGRFVSTSCLFDCIISQNRSRLEDDCLGNHEVVAGNDDDTKERKSLRGIATRKRKGVSKPLESTGDVISPKRRVSRRRR